jgi:hypothetical protein
MSWNVEYDPDLGAVAVALSGVVGLAELREAVGTAMAEADRQEVVKVLVDCRDLIGGHSVVDLYDMARSFPPLVGPRGFRQAVVSPAGGTAARDVRFWVTACVNLGLDVRDFEAVEDARGWLREP